MIKLSSKLFWKIGSFFHLISKKIYITIQEKRMIPWLKIKGDRTLRLQYSIPAKSVVFDIGGFEGQWASDIYSMYKPNIYIFEPVVEFANNISKRFINNPDIKIFPFGLSNKDLKTKISLSSDSTSIYKKGNEIDIVLKDITNFIKENKINDISLLKINIEGGEYDVLQRLIDTGLIKMIHNIQIQFHDFVPEATERMTSIRSDLSKTHKLTYQYDFVWENWEIIR